MRNEQEVGVRTLLVVDDEQDLLDGLARILEEERLRVITTTDPDAVEELVRRYKPDMALTDYKMPKKNGFELLKQFAEIAPGMPVVMISAYATSEGVVEAVKRGAFDYLIKPFSADQLIVTVRRAMAFATLQKEKDALASALQEDQFTRSFVGSNAVFLESVRLIKKVACSTVNVFLVGEPGVGKESAARLIHFHGARAEQPFRSINCATLEEAPLEDQAGECVLWSQLFDTTEGGTLYLANIDALGVYLQGKLLNEMGKRKAFPVVKDVSPRGTRIIASTSAKANSGKESPLLEQLRTTLCVVTITLPPLRKRIEDIGALTDLFLARIAQRENKTRISLAPDTLAALQEYHWPGNMIELESALEQAVAHAAENTPLLDDFPEVVCAPSRLTTLDYKTAKKGCLDRFERQYVEELLKSCNGNISKASERACLARMSLYRMMRRIGMNPNEVAVDRTAKWSVKPQERRK